MWWRTAEANSQTLATTINQQIVSAVERQLTTITTEARAAHTTIRTLFLQTAPETREADKREFVFLSQLQSQQSISWVAFGRPDGGFFAVHKLGDLGSEMIEIAPVDGKVKRRVDQYQVLVGDIEIERGAGSKHRLRRHRSAMVPGSNQSRRPALFRRRVHPVGARPSNAYAGPIDVYQKRQGALAVIIEYTRLSQFLSQLAVGKSGAAFILGRDGATFAALDPDTDEVHMQQSDQQLLPIAPAALKQAAIEQPRISYESGKKIARQILKRNAFSLTHILSF